MRTPILAAELAPQYAGLKQSSRRIVARLRWLSLVPYVSVWCLYSGFTSAAFLDLYLIKEK